MIWANRPATISVSDEATNEQLSLDADHIGFQNLKWQRRNAQGARYLATLKMPGYPAILQEMQIYPMHPITLTAEPVKHGILPVTVENPSGTAISARVRYSSAALSMAVDFALDMGEKTTLVLLGAGVSSTAPYTVRLTLEERMYGFWCRLGKRLLLSPPITYTPLRATSWSTTLGRRPQFRITL